MMKTGFSLLVSALLTLTAAEAATTAAKQPFCNVFSVDMAFLGSEGLITDRNRALLVVSCSKAAKGFCGKTVDSCLTVAGPATYSFSNIGFADARETSYQTFLSWERDYLGPVTVSMGCQLEDQEGTQLSMPTETLKFQVVPNAAVRSSAFRVGDGDALSVPAPGPAL